MNQAFACSIFLKVGDRLNTTKISGSQKANTRLKRLGLGLSAFSVLLGLALLVLDPLPMQTLRNNLFDQYQRWHPREYVNVPVRIVDIDEETLARHGQWPWPRLLLSTLVETLKEAGAASIGLDVVLAEADRTSPKSMAGLWPQDDALHKALKKLPDHDEVFAGSLQDAGVTVGLVLQSRLDPTRVDQHLRTEFQKDLAHRPFRYIQAGEGSGRRLHDFDGAITALPAFQKAAAGNGALNFVADSDGIIRRAPLLLGLSGEPVPSLIAESLRVAQGEKNYFLKSDGKDLGLAEVKVGAFEIPTTSAGEIWIHYARPVENRYLPAWKVLAGAVPRDLLDGHMVLVGSSAQGLMDLRFSPLGGIMPGVEVHAQALEQIVSGHVLKRPGWALVVESIAIAIGGLAIALLSVRATALTAATTAAVLISAVLVGGWLLFLEYGLLLNTITPALIFGMAFVLGSLIHHFVSEREQRWIKAVFSRYVSPNRVNYLVDHPGSMELGGNRQECSFVFTDLANFTALMESIDPGSAVALLNDYLDEMIAIAFRFEGTLDRIVGDAVAIMFSAPVPQSDHRQRALSCALAMDAFAARYAREQNARGIAFGKTRIGIHTGEVIVGNFGGSTIFDYRALGDPVNTASRLESVNKYLGTSICVSEATLAGCPDANVRPVGRLVLKGKTEGLLVFEPLIAGRQEGYAPLDEYMAAYKLLHEGGFFHGAACRRFDELAGFYPNDPLVVLHQKRLAGGAYGNLMVMSEK